MFFFKQKQPEDSTVNVLPKRTWVYIVFLFFAVSLLTAIIVLVAVFFIFKYAVNREAVNPNRISVTLSSDAPLLGNREASVRIVEFADFQCPYCKEFHDTILPSLKRDYIDTGKVSFYFQNFSFLGPESVTLAEAAQCAKFQNKFWEFHDLLYEKQVAENSGAWNDASAVLLLARSLGLQENDFSNCINSDSTIPTIQTETESARSAGVQATPTLAVDDIKLEGISTYEELKAVIDEQLSKK